MILFFLTGIRHHGRHQDICCHDETDLTIDYGLGTVAIGLRTDAGASKIL